MTNIIKLTSEKLDKVVEYFINEIRNVRTGRANSMLVEDIKVDIYGQNMRIRDIASITVPDALSILISPWDKSNLKSIEGGLRETNLGVGIVNAGDNIRVTLPELSAERREELKKMVEKKAEEVKVSMRNIRREAMDEVKKKEKNKEIGEDDVRRAEKEIQGILDKKIEEIEKLAEIKEKEISQ